MKESTKDKDEVHQLFQQYLEICNQAMNAHSHDFPYRQFLSISNALIGDEAIDLAIYDDRPKAAFSLTFKDNILTNGGYPDDVKKAWRVNLSYLQKVVENPEDHIAHPEKLDLDWLKSRLDYR